MVSDHKTVRNATLTTVTEALWRWGRGLVRACRWRRDGAVIPGKKRGLSPIIRPIIREIRVYEIVATACNQPPCPNGAPAAGYVERRLTATLSKCKDSTAAAPRCACG